MLQIAFDVEPQNAAGSDVSRAMKQKLFLIFDSTTGARLAAFSCKQINRDGSMFDAMKKTEITRAKIEFQECIFSVALTEP